MYIGIIFRGVLIFYMQFSPNNYIKYAAALRFYLQKKILKHGINYKTRKLLSKIMLFEIIVCKKMGVPTDIHCFFNKLCCAFSVELLKRHKWPEIYLNGKGRGIINRELLIYLLVNCKNAQIIKIDIRKNYIKITTDNLSDEIYQTKNYLIIREMKQNKYGIFIPFKECENSVKKSPDEYDYLLDPLSTLKVFFED